MRCWRGWCRSRAPCRRSTRRSCDARRTTTIASHSDIVNQLFHIISSSVFLGCYVLAFSDLTTAMWAGLAALFLRQIGHAILEPPCHDKEATLLGYNTRNKTTDPRHLSPDSARQPRVVRRLDTWTRFARWPATVAYEWFAWTAGSSAGRVAYLVWAHGPRLALVWFVKLATDPLTDVIAYTPRFLRPA